MCAVPSPSGVEGQTAADEMATIDLLDGIMRSTNYLEMYDENVEEDRQGVVDLFTDKEIKELIRQKNIQLISYKDVTN